ncbi:MAG: DMT family transporter [Alphaproteobacteria bacterium]|nr:DMT family transporter [Alphaproteobacteria bacterium]NCQ88946.1 DMT family transporter [Alphaproteobacteria bacterium]NCT07848.1 DMT family transporter [Alphaproteobacteria bacterium]
MNIAILFPVLAFMAGAMTAFQPLTNAKLNQHVDSAIWVSFISFAFGTVLLFVLGMITQGKFMTLEMSGLKWWMFVSGALGAFYVTAALYVVPYLGVAVLASLSTAGALIMSAILSHYGVLSDMPRPITMQKFVGMTLLAIGAIVTLKA